MVLRLSTLFLRTLREDPADADVASHRLLVRAGYIRRAAPGIYSWLPLGLRVLGKVENIIREEMAAIGAQEVHFPALLPREPYETSNRWTEYGENLFRLQDRKGADYLLAPTHEEMFTLLVKDLYNSYKDLPVSLFQIQTKYRDEARPRAGLLRGREFIMKDSYSFDMDDEGLDASYQAHREAYLRIFERLGLEIVVVSAVSGAMGGSKSEEFLHPMAVGEDTYVRSAGGYAANVEAVTTVVPADIDYTGAPAARVVDTPDTPTIETLVNDVNARFPCEAGEWSAADTLKNVVLAVTLPTGERRIVVVGVPGDRAVDLKRIEANISSHVGMGGELAVDAATDEDLKKHPGLVKGYIGPGLSTDEPVLGTESATGLLYLVDPRVVTGTSWITGANESGKHVIGLVAGRDFTWDGTIEAVEVREGDEAPDGSGPLEAARGIEMGHIFQLGRKYADALGLKVLDRNGKLATVTMGSYGVGVTRAVAALAESHHDDKGIIWPRAVAPADVHVVATGRGSEIFDAAAQLSEELEAAGLEVIYDDRPKVSPGVKFGDAELIGVPTILVVGRGLADGVVEIKDRATGNAENVPVAEAVEYVRRAAAQ
ncbi:MULTISPECIES: proline--tRNA ligase [unclassified Arthrobacter]|uniref:proline--tRNA ligase n=1 Tax=unclassified Arthrobacter TaxID=235627 RepID=UPI001D14E029|nr:proline--tRNA ligase [Arthrobacter sp. zg-Y1110]MCC3292715.1 proline--tRNA ligase [Arthrobacter sp. zg-Y1110]MCC3303092.1 proline--tRNA ligase [Arthrobacter sp. zg-Y895]UWX85994.1 proline--tRNA ligase [Arthrobacter sp. zg-Y1110]